MQTAIETRTLYDKLWQSHLVDTSDDGEALLYVALPADAVDALFMLVERSPGTRFHIDLPSQIVTPNRGEAIAFDIDAGRKMRLLDGLDDIALTLQRAESIRSYETRRKLNEPWLFA